MAAIEVLSVEGINLIEMSGGTYESPEMMDTAVERLMVH